MTIEDHDDSSGDDQEDDDIEVLILGYHLNMQINRPTAYNYYKRPRPTNNEKCFLLL